MGGRVALVTGGSRGIGAATAKALARDGHRVAVTYSSDMDGAHDVVADLDAIGEGGLALRADARDAESVDAAFASVEEMWGPVEVLVANAGVTADGLIVRMDLPGLTKEDVKIEVVEGSLTISGERKYETKEERPGWYSSERAYGKFYRAIPLPEGVNAAEVRATIRDGGDD